MQETHVVTCFLLRGGAAGRDEVLILRRGRRVGTYRERWAGVSGYLEAPTPLEQAYTELREETRLIPDDVQLLAEGKPVTVDDPELGRRWIVHPFLFRVADPARIVTDWEHVAVRWVSPNALSYHDTVPGLARALAAVYPPSEE